MHPAVRDLYEKRRLTLIAGPCVIESADVCLRVAEHVARCSHDVGVGYIFKASFDKANRTSIESPRGPGLEAGLRVLEQVRAEIGVPVLTDIHIPEQAAPAADVVDVLQIPAFLCRQTDLLVAAAQTGRPTNVKKGQFLAPEDMRHVTTKFREGGGQHICVTERGSSFGYHNLVVDMRSLPTMAAATGTPVVFDATHSVQRPSTGEKSGGDRTLAPVLARAAVAVGVDGLFSEVHPEPDHALSDGPNSLDFDLLGRMLQEVSAFDATRRAL